MGAVQSLVRKCFGKTEDNSAEFTRNRTTGASIVKEDPDGPLDATSRENILEDLNSSESNPKPVGRSKTMESGREKARILNETFNNTIDQSDSDQSKPLLDQTSAGDHFDEVDGIRSSEDNSSNSSSVEDHQGRQSVASSLSSNSKKSSTEELQKEEIQEDNNEDEDYDLPKPFNGPEDGPYDLPKKNQLERLNSDYDYPQPMSAQNNEDPYDMPREDPYDMPKTSNQSSNAVPKAAMRIDSDYDELPVRKSEPEMDYDELPLRSSREKLLSEEDGDYDELPKKSQFPPMSQSQQSVADAEEEYDELPLKNKNVRQESIDEDYDVPRNWQN